jgi:hypothetical protein
MSNAGIQSWTLTAADNVTVNGINIAENCPAANINNAIRQIMSSAMMEIAYQGADISASVSMSLAGADWRFMAVTGSASVIHVGTGRAGLVRNVLWNSQSTLVGSANIITDGGGNIVTATNDVTIFTSLGSGAWRAQHTRASGGPNSESLMIALSGETAGLVTATAAITVRAPYACILGGVRANVNTVSSSGVITFDLNKTDVSGTAVSILSTKLTIDANEKSSVTAAAPAVISDQVIPDDQELTVDIDGPGTGAKGAKLTLLWYKR